MGLQNTLKALSDPVRREILELLKQRRMSAGEICDHFDITAAAISRHLSVLKEADLIRDDRQGKYIYYEESFEDVFILNKKSDALQFHVTPKAGA